MKLFEHPDFGQAILQAAEHFRGEGRRPAIIEKDYFVTEALRIIAANGEKVIFKGGTSLAKGWNLIRRFSEDIDIFLDPAAFQPPLGKRAIDRELRKLRDAVAAHPALTLVPNEGKTIGGFGRNDVFSYVQRFGGPGEVANRVVLEAGAASGREPTASIELRSHLGQFLQERGLSVGAKDEGPFLHATTAFPADVRREDVRHPRQSGTAQTRRTAARILCEALLRPIPTGRTGGSDCHAEVGRVRCHQGGL